MQAADALDKGRDIDGTEMGPEYIPKIANAASIPCVTPKLLIHLEFLTKCVRRRREA